MATFKLFVSQPLKTVAMNYSENTYHREKQDE